MITPASGEYLTMAEVSQHTRVSIDTLRWWRHRNKGEGPKSFRLGRRVMYAAADVQAWLDQARAGGPASSDQRAAG